MLLEVAYSHRHKQHEQIGIIVILFGNEYSGPARVAELDYNIFGRERIAYLDEVWGAESDNHVVARERAGEFHASGSAEVVVLRFHLDILRSDAEFHQTVAGVDEYANSAQCVEHRVTVDSE